VRRREVDMKSRNPRATIYPFDWITTFSFVFCFFLELRETETRIDRCQVSAQLSIFVSQLYRRVFFLCVTENSFDGTLCQLPFSQRSGSYH
jgi:hypothetical protein